VRLAPQRRRATLFACPSSGYELYTGTAALKFVYSRVFEVPTRRLLEFFGTFPFHPPLYVGRQYPTGRDIDGAIIHPAFSICGTHVVRHL